VSDMISLDGGVLVALVYFELELYKVIYKANKVIYR
jgi:hypothetical protein